MSLPPREPDDRHDTEDAARPLEVSTPAPSLTALDDEGASISLAQTGEGLVRL